MLSNQHILTKTDRNKNSIGSRFQRSCTVAAASSLVHAMQASHVHFAHEELLSPVLEPAALKDFCEALHGNGQRRALEQVLRCLDLAGSRHDAWPALQKDLCEDLRKMLVLHRSDAAAASEKKRC